MFSGLGGSVGSKGAGESRMCRRESGCPPIAGTPGHRQICHVGLLTAFKLSGVHDSDQGSCTAGVFSRPWRVGVAGELIECDKVHVAIESALHL